MTNIPRNPDLISEYDNFSKTRKRKKVYTELRFDYTPNIQRKDIDTGYIVRYFARRTNLNSGEIVEISKKQATKLKKYPIFKVIEVKWKISGRLDDEEGPRHVNSPTRLYTGVITSNRLAVEDAEEELPGIKNKLKNYAEFHQA